jgi:hypothetical protein
MGINNVMQLDKIMYRYLNFTASRLVLISHISKAVSYKLCDRQIGNILMAQGGHLWLMLSGAVHGRWSASQKLCTGLCQKA